MAHDQIEDAGAPVREETDAPAPLEKSDASGNGNASGSHRPGTTADERPASARKPFYRQTPFRVFFIILLILSAGALVYWLHARNFEDTDDAFIDGHIIPISPQVSALVTAVHVSDNQFVHKGDLLVELDETDYRVALQQAQGAQASAEGKLQQAQSAVPAAQSAVTEAQAELAAAQVNFTNADQQLKRYQGLDARAQSKQQLDDDVAAQKTAAAQVEQAKARLQSAQTQVLSAKASIVAAQGDLAKARADASRAAINLGYCRIFAPCDGRITTKDVNPGMYVTPATQFFNIVPSDVWVVANFKETQLDQMRVGQPVTIHVDAYPERDYQGEVQSIQAGTGSRFSVIPAENATGNFVKVVQRVPVKILFKGEPNSDPDHFLAPGMSVEPTVRIRSGWF